MDSDIQKVMKLNRHALNSKAQLKSFTEQYGEYAIVRQALNDKGYSQTKTSKELQDLTPFVLSLNASIFGVEPLNDMPLVITNRAFRHIRKKHLETNGANPILAARELSQIFDGIVDKMLTNVLVYQDPKTQDHYVFVLAEYSSTGKPITTIVEANVLNKDIEVVGIVSNHGNGELWDRIKASLDLSLSVYVNERTGAWLLNVRDLGRSSGTELLANSTAPDVHGTNRLEAIRRLFEIYITQFPDTPEADFLSRDGLKDAAAAYEDLHPDADFVPAKEGAELGGPEDKNEGGLE